LIYQTTGDVVRKFGCWLLDFSPQFGVATNFFFNVRPLFEEEVLEDTYRITFPIYLETGGWFNSTAETMVLISLMIMSNIGG
jgi:hypothetical protein